LLVIALIVSDALYPYISSGNYNDDAASRPVLHGAYRILPGSRSDHRWERLFMHRQGYLILQDDADRFQDYTLSVDTAKQLLWVSRSRDSLEYALDYRFTDRTLNVYGSIAGDSLNLRLARLWLRY